MYAIGNDELEGQPKAKKGDMVPCPGCGERHPLEYGTTNDVETDFMGFVSCGKDGYLVTIQGKILPRRTAEPT